ncbi:hypothetical protein JST56_07380 [Candidatus Dependentiae bacterium]|nr:hypothetical protein [Candidatus Dependentiae bacterium]
MVATRYNRLFMSLLVFCALSISTVCLSKEPARPYNFDNGDAFGYGNACWLTSYLQCAYRLEPLRNLLAKLPQQKGNDSEALKFSRLIKKTFDEMSVKKNTKNFPKELYNTIYDKTGDLFLSHKKSYYGVSIQEKPELDPRSVVTWDIFGESAKAGDASHAELDPIKKAELEARRDRLYVYGEILLDYYPSQKSTMSDHERVNQLFLYIIKKTFNLKRAQLARYFQITDKPISLGGYELVAHMVSPSHDHVAALVRYGNDWYFYDSLWNVNVEPNKAEKVLDHGTEYFQDSVLKDSFYKDYQKPFPVNLYFYQNSELGIKLFELKEQLIMLKEKLVVLKNQLGVLKNKLATPIKK